MLVSQAIATAEVIYDLALSMKATINAQAAENLLVAIMSDSLGFSIQSVSARTFKIASELIELGASSHEIEHRRREFMKKSAEILKYKGILIERIEYYLDGKLAIIKIPFDEIQTYSDQYNPSVLVLDEMRLVEGVEIGVAIKTYPDGKLTGKIRTNMPIAANVAGYFGGGGHDYAAGFRVYDSIETIMPELLNAADKSIKEAINDAKAS
jgi:phosphoesterase RecJ-like protein